MFMLHFPLMKRIFIFLAALSCYAAYSQTGNEHAVIKAMHTISSHDLMSYAREMCDERYGGRLTGTREYQECAEWLASGFAEWGLVPAGDKGSWFQCFDVPYTMVLPDCGLSLQVPIKGGGMVNKHYTYVSEYMPGSTSGSGEVTSEVVYAGYGITAPELNYDDYAGLDVKGKIVLIDREAPVPPSAGAEKFNPWYRYSFHQHKLENAVKHGAAGMLYNYGPIANPNNAYNSKFIYVHVGDSVVKDIFSGTGIKHEERVAMINKSLRPSSFRTGKVATVKMSTRHFPDGKGCNVIGLIKGSDSLLSSEVIIISAHLDHLGRCFEIMPGANDNASAVAVMMGVAKALSVNQIALKRSVMFVAFGSEEQALLGSRKYAESPLIPAEKSVVLNMDAVGAGETIIANAGINYPVLWSFIENANSSYIHRNVVANTFNNLGRPRLDAAILMKAGIPSLSFSTAGTSYAYHLPQDDIASLNPEIMEDMCRLLFVAVTRMANSPVPLR